MVSPGTISMREETFRAILTDIVTSLQHDFLPSSWGMYHGTFWDVSTYLGTIGLFFSLMFLFIRFLPSISIFEMRTILPEAKMDEKP